MNITTDHPLLQQAATIALADLRHNIRPYKGGLLTEPQPCLLAGGNYTHPWTRDAAYNNWYGLALLDPVVAKNTLLAVLTRDEHGLRIGGQYWDAMVWALGAWSYYQYTLDKAFLPFALEAVQNSLDYFEETEFDPVDGLFRGASTFSDGVAGYPDRYVCPNASSAIFAWPEHNPDKRHPKGFGLPMKAFSTNLLYANAYRIACDMAARCGQEERVPEWRAKATELLQAIDRAFWDPGTQRYRYLVDPWGGDERQESWGQAMAILFDAVSSEKQEKILAQAHRTPQGIPCLWPTYERYLKRENILDYLPTPQELPDLANDPLTEADVRPDLPLIGHHSGNIWPQINVSWALACAKHDRLEEAFHELILMAEKAVRDGTFRENFHPETGDPYGGAQEWELAGGIILWPSCRQQSWCAMGFLHLLTDLVLGMQVTPDTVTFSPSRPEGLHTLEIQEVHLRGESCKLRLSPENPDQVLCETNRPT